MKNITLIFGILLMISCSEEDLTRYPLTSVSSETFWNTENDLRVYNNNFYNFAKSNAMRLLNGNHEGANRNGQYSLDGMTDNDVRAVGNNKSHVEIRAGQINPEESPISWAWNNTCFQFVRSINIGLENYDKADLEPSVIDNYKAEARLFRAWVVADKVSLYGDYPWIDKELNIDSDELYAARTPREEVMDKVLDDLNFATLNLPEDWSDDGSPGRLDRWCALLIKSRICLFEGTWRKYHGGNNPEQWLQAAADAAKELMDLGPYQLYSTGDPNHDYNAVFQMNDLTGVDEVMYWRRYQQGVVENSWQIYYYMSTATKDMVEDYLCTDGLPANLSPLYQGDDRFQDVFKNRDPRLRQSVIHPEDVKYYNYGGLADNDVDIPNLVGMTGSWVSLTGYHQVKHVNQEQNVYFHNGFTPCVILRYGEALLNFAEAKAELGTLTQADLDLSINKLRDRVGMVHMDINNIPVDPRYAQDGVSPLLVELRRERRIELFAEGFRFNDIRRWHQGEKMRKKDYGIRWDEANRNRIDPEENNQVPFEEFEDSGKIYICPNKGSDFEFPVFEEKHYLWPIPVSARSQNPNLGQNPGWE